MKFVPTIGLEIHAELHTATKLFCRCPNTSSDLTSKPNTSVCPTCLGLPGALPVLNKAAVEATIKLGQSLGCTIPEVTKWDRKNYFYPDLPKGYQISQYDQPLCSGGALEVNGQAVALTRIHLEEDTGKLTHVGNESLIDYNRSSIPLLELVTEPVVTSSQQAKAFCQEYQHHLRDLGVAEASMEKGQMRCEANISIYPEGADPFSGTKVEVKNLNSFKSLEKAIEYEITRQTEVLQSGGSIAQETRGWNETKGETYSMRVKETSDDYRYFPEPDLYPLNLSDLSIENTGLTRAEIKKLLDKTGINGGLIDIILNENKSKRLNYLKRVLDIGIPNDLLGTFAAFLAVEPKLMNFEPDDAMALMQKYHSGTLTPAAVKQVITLTTRDNLLKKIDQVLQEHSDASGQMESVVQTVIQSNPTEVSRYKTGEKQLFGFFVGQVKKALQGAGDPAAIAAELKKQLGG